MTKNSDFPWSYLNMYYTIMKITNVILCRTIYGLFNECFIWFLITIGRVSFDHVILYIILSSFIIYILIHLLIIQQTTIFPGNIIISSDIYREDKLISYARIKETYKPTFITKILRSKFTPPSNPRLPTNNPSIIQLFNIDLHHQIINRKIQPSQPDPFPISKDTLFT